MDKTDNQGGDALPDHSAMSPREFVETVYDACADELYRYALLLLMDHALAEDAVHQAFAKLLRMGPRVLEIQSSARYLRTAVRNECWRIIEKKRRHPQSTDAAEQPLLEAAPATGVDEDERIQLEAALRSLPADQREVVHMKVYEGRTFQQIADLTGLSINTVASRHRYAMDKLRQLLNRHPDQKERPDETG